MKQQHLQQGWALLSLLALLGTLAVNALANALPINGITTGEASALYPNLFVPAGYTFGIWGVIYLLLTAYVVYQLTTVFGRSSGDRSFINQSAPWFILSSLANMGWILAWHHLYIGLSVILMLLLLGSLLVLYLKLGIGVRKSPPTVRYLVHLPFSVYLGWISVATIANVTAWLVSVDWNGWGFPPFLWPSVMLLVACVIGLQLLYRRKDLWFNLVLLWAIGGIITRLASTPGQNHSGLIIIISFMALNILVNSVLQLLKRKVY